MAKGENISKGRMAVGEARYIKTREKSGKIKYGFCYGKTYMEAKDKAAEARAKLLSGTVPKPEVKAENFRFIVTAGWIFAAHS